jgi:hypothetical protein
MEARKPGDVLGTVEVFSPSYYWRQSGYLAQPVIEFSIRNDGRSRFRAFTSEWF